MEKQTAVEWLFNWMENNQYFIGNDLLKAIEQAKEMEKEQIEIAFEQGMINSADYYIPRSSGKEIIPECENYYKETYENK
jgi:hypothetical protein